jgi:5-methylcytosine-specific restriction endonuclease McrA
MKGRTGQDNPNWRGGKHLVDALRKQLRPSWWTVRDEERADECYNCGASECKLDVHHIVPLSAGGTNDSWNLMTLCESCHRTVEAYTRDLPGMEAVIRE